MNDDIPNMDPNLRKEISQLNRDQYATLFWQVYGYMRVQHYDKITAAVESAMFDVRNEGSVSTSR